MTAPAKKAPAKKASARKSATKSVGRAPRRTATTAKGAAAAALLVDRMEALVERMRGFIDAEKAALEFLDNRGWCTLKFPSCHEFWANRMSDVRVNDPVKKRAAFEMFEEGLTPRRVADIVKDLGPNQAVALLKHKGDGREWHESALTYTVPKSRGKSDTKLVVIEVERIEYEANWVPAAETAGMTISDYIYEATREKVERDSTK